MAAPFVSGLASILCAVPGNCSPSKIAQEMESTALDLGVPGVDPMYGYGLIQMDAAIRLALHPTVISIARDDADPTNAAIVDFTVAFSKDVTGVDAGATFDDFTLAITSLTGASITSVSGSGDTYTVSVDTGSGNGTIRLDIVDDDSILDENDNPLGGTGIDNGSFSTGEEYTIVKITTFSDVPVNHQLYANIQALWDAGFTAGCSADPLMYCPETVMDRAQSAVFMLRGQLGSGYVPPAEP
jgi:hypothetical protein